MKKTYYKRADWCGVQSLFSNALGLTSGQNVKNAANKSVNFVSRLICTDTLEFHEGCVNAVNFSPSGDLIASGSDDKNICIWDWCKNTSSPLLHYNSGHSSNVFQVTIILYYLKLLITKSLVTIHKILYILYTNSMVLVQLTKKSLV